MEKLLEKDMVIRILALVIASLLWLQASSEQSPFMEKTLNDVPVRLQNVEEGYTVVGEVEPVAVDVTIYGSQNLIAGIASRDLNVYVDLSDKEDGTHTLPIRAMEPTGIQVTEIAPLEANVTVEEIVRKEFTVSIIQQGLPSLGYSIGNVTFEPEEVSIEGAKSIIESIKNAAVVVDVNNVTDSFERNVPVNVFDESGSVVQDVNVIPQTVTVSIEVVQAQVEKEVSVKPSLVGEPAEGYRIIEIDLEPRVVLITGSEEIIDEISSLSTTPIEIQGAESDIERIVGLQLPTGVAAIDSASFQVNIRIGQEDMVDEDELEE